ncbi:hypothetical protein [Planktothrix paucivesiculata]|nr:hypothetical protein [Planktothrix paucivesiculata]
MPLVFRVSSAVGENLPLTHYTMMLSDDAIAKMISVEFLRF